MKLALIAILLSTNVYILCQTKITKGHLLAYDFRKGVVVYADSSLKWEQRAIKDSSINESYIDHFTYLGKDYFLSSKYTASPHVEFEEKYIKDAMGKGVTLLYKRYGYIDVMGMYFFYKPRITYTEKGIWFSDGVNGCYFFDAINPIVKQPADTVACISGKMLGSYLITRLVTNRNYNLVDLSNSPKIILKDKVELVSATNLTAPVKIGELQNNYYLLQLFTSVYLVKLSDKKIIVEGLLIDNRNVTDYQGWTYKGDYIYYRNKDKFLKAKINYDTKALQDTTVILEGISSSRSYSFNEDANVFSAITGKQLLVYSISSDSILANIDISQYSSSQNNPIVTNNIVYIHVIDKITDVKKEEVVPTEFRLEQNYPNPFNPETVISYQLSAVSHVTLKVYDLLGREVATLVDEYKPAGSYVETLHATSLPSGIYFYTLHAGDPSTGSGQSFIQTKKMVLMK